ncbi:putative enzyme related to lactoylglutathione lyase [Povalibacter uvarum]|uniref:Putative enzyme related to lactoylglutathione lyase n=1 Tax=Povalibacter uvarum TaxID=732238 RepID=A0A841HQU2_9GAMM|nr:VOC family protein [Povalibacter uvarum]MBB6094468.1 putative enzyme related to lactoylglutathione lyase [Povalibacter uvarum]
MADQSLRGRFVWHELKTPNAGESHAFYQRVVGWKAQPWERDTSYTLLSGGGEPIAATVASEGDEPQWIHYIGTADVDATVAQATELGATVTKEPTDIPNGARYAILSDPQGATFAVYASPPPHQREKDPRRGQFSWMELASTDAKAALDFYCTLFGWERSAAHDMGPLGFYYVFSRNGRDLGGAFDKPAAMPGPSAWLGYIRGKDLDKVAQVAKKAGGTLINGPMEVPGGDWIAQFVDAHGAAFAVHVLKNDLAQAAAHPQMELAVEAEAPPPRKKAAAKKPAAKKPAAKAKPAEKKSTAAPKRVAKKSGKKTTKRSTSKASTVRGRSVKAKAKAKTAGRKRSAVVAKKSAKNKTRARPKKGK